MANYFHSTIFCAWKGVFHQNMPLFSSDLALEAAEQLGAAGKNARRLEGVRTEERFFDGYCVTSVSVTGESGSRALNKPVGRYVTVDLSPYFQRQDHFFPRGVHCLSRQLRHLLPRLHKNDTVLVAGLGNRSLACDAVGPTAVENLLVTRHIVNDSSSPFSSFSSVAAIATGVVSQTGIETLELITGAAQHISPAAVIVIDALCARSRKRLCATVQLSDTGLIPGSGVGNHRAAIDRATLGVPVIAIGIPTVIAGNSLAQELTGEPAEDAADLFLTPRDVFSRVAELGRLVGFSISAALHPQLTIEDITGLLS